MYDDQLLICTWSWMKSNRIDWRYSTKTIAWLKIGYVEKHKQDLKVNWTDKWSILNDFENLIIDLLNTLSNELIIGSAH